MTVDQDRISEIRSRLDAIGFGVMWNAQFNVACKAVSDHAWDDLEWLLGEVERMSARIAELEKAALALKTKLETCTVFGSDGHSVECVFEEDFTKALSDLSALLPPKGRDNG